MAKVKIALVTGASSGIGEATAQRLATAGYRVYGTSRRGVQAGKRPFEMLALDVTSDESVTAAVSEVIGREGRIDLLVNNAGFGVAPAGAEESSIEQARSIFETNFFGLIRVTRAVLPQMRGQGSGRIINISSVLGFLPMPYGALYAATKHAVEGYSESLDHELRTRGIRVSTIEPAYTKTPFDANFIEPDVKLDEYREARAAVSRRVNEVIGNRRIAGCGRRHRIEGGKRDASENSIHSRQAREPPATSTQVCARRPGRCRDSKGPPA